MPLILNIETTTTNCSVCLSENKKIIFTKEEDKPKYSHSENLHKFILKTLDKAQKTPQEISAVAVSQGPGSYTGLRIGFSAAKGLCLGLGVPLITINVMKILAQQGKKISPNNLIAPLIKIRQEEVYLGLYNRMLEKKQKEQILTPTKETLAKELTKEKILFIGPGALKVKKQITNTNANFFVTNPSAQHMPPLSYQKLQKKETANVAHATPSYFKNTYKKLTF